MTQLNLKVSKALGADLTQVSGLGAVALTRLSDRLHQDGHCIIKPADLRAVITEVVGSEAAPVVERVLLGLSALRRQGHVSAEEVLKSLTQSIDQLDWDESQRKGWETVQSQLASLLENQSIIVTAKAVDLLYDYE